MPETTLPNGHTLVYGDAGDGWLSGQLKEDPRAISQARTLDELIENILDAKRLLDQAD